MSKQKIIIVERMYVGDYLSWGDNIGHEAINLYPDDNGNYYNYLPAPGNVPKKYNDVELEKADITVLMVRNYAKGIWKIIGKLENCEVLPSAYTKPTSKKRKELLESDLGDVSYGRVPIQKLFNDNIETKNSNSDPEDSNPDPDENDVPLLATFKAEDKALKVSEKEKPIFITANESLKDESNNIFYIKTNFTKSSLRQYFPENYNEENNEYDPFTVLNKLITDEKRWKGEVNGKIEIPEDEKNKNREEDSSLNFMNIIKQEDNELAFSNMFAYIFTKHKDLFQEFAKKHLGVNIDKNYKVEREKHNIDILISDKDTCIVIENKIKSSINGIPVKDEDRYAKDKAGNKKLISQLSKYYEYVKGDEDNKNDKNKGDEEYKNKKHHHFFIFVPNYNYKSIDNKKFFKGEKYTKIKYGDIYNFFKDHEIDGAKDDIYFKEFVKSLEKHTKSYDDSLESEMQRRFYNAIKSANE